MDILFLTRVLYDINININHVIYKLPVISHISFSS